MKAFLDARVLLLAGISLLFMGGLSVIMTLFPIVGEAEIRGGLAFVGTAFTVSAISGLLLGPLAGRISDRRGRPALLFVGVIFAATEGTALFLSRDPWLIAAGFCLGGIGAAAFFNALYAAVGDLTNRCERGRLTGTIGLASESGGILGSILAPIVWQQTDLRTPFCLQLGFTALAVVLIIVLGKSKPLMPSRKAVVQESILPG